MPKDDLNPRGFGWDVRRLVLLYLEIAFFCPYGLAVTSRIQQIASGQDLAKGEVNNVLIGSRGTITLGHPAQELAGGIEGVWSINSIVDCGGTVYLGTSPNGQIFRYSTGRLTKVYPTEKIDPNVITNEHVFAMAIELSGAVIAGISGQDCRLVRIRPDGLETICKLTQDRYIFCLAVDQTGAIYIGTGPEGRIYVFDRSSREARLVYDSQDKNILSLALDEDGLVYAGTDGRGVIYRIDPRHNSAAVLYDCPQPEVTGLLFVGRDLYAIATSAKLVPTEREGPSRVAEAMPGRPESSRGPGRPSESQPSDGRILQVANTRRESAQEGPSGRQPPPRRAERPDSASHLYCINPAGYVRDVTSQNAVLFCLAADKGELLIGTGNDARLICVDPAEEQVYTFYQDRQSTQITSIAVGKDIFIGTANPAKLIRLGRMYANEGVYTSDLVDAQQPAQWGKLHLEADIPDGCRVLMSCRGGNVEDANDPSYSPWTQPVEVTGPVQLTCPVARFCQFRLILRTDQPQKTPVIRKITLASTIPNLAPVVASIDVTRLGSSPSRQGLYKVTYKASDRNDDKLIYSIYIRRLGRSNWILLKEGHEEDTFEWDGRTVEDGRYEIKVVASDQRSNSPPTALTGSRISDPVVVDNTGPAIRGHWTTRTEKAATVVLAVVDNLSVIGQVEYTIDSNSQWQVAIPDDGVCDTTEEHFTIQLDGLTSGEHILAIKASDDLGNTTYRSFEIPRSGGPKENG